MPSTKTQHSSPRYYLNTDNNCNSTSTSNNNTESGKSPYSIDDADLMFDGKPLNMLYEENRWHVTEMSGKDKSRGRSRTSKK